MPSGMPVSASRPEGRSSARIGLPARFMASTTVARAPSTGRVRPVPRSPSTSQSASASRESSSAGRGSSRVAIKPGRLIDSGALENDPLGLRITAKLCPCVRTRRSEPENPRRPDAARPRPHPRRCFPARTGSEFEDGPGTPPASSASQAAAPRPAFSIKIKVGSSRSRAA